MVTKLNQGAVLVTIEIAGTEYWRVGDAKPIPPFVQNQNTVQGTVKIYDVIGDDEIDLGTVNQVTDYNSKVYKPLIGPRPRNVVRR